MLELLRSNLVVLVLGLASLAAIFYLYRELRRAKAQLAEAAEEPSRKRVKFAEPEAEADSDQGGSDRAAPASDHGVPTKSPSKEAPPKTGEPSRGALESKQ